MMIDRTLDISVLYEPPILPELKSVRIGQLKLVMASSIIGITAASAFSSDYVYVDWGTSFAMFHADKFGEVVPTVLSVNLASIAHRYIQENPGTAYLPSILVGDDVVNQVKNTPTFRKPVYICYRANHEQLELIQNIIDLVDDISI
jgi:DNA-binding transcriptional LysR family regulator